MLAISNSIFIYLLAVILVLLTSLALYVKWAFQYWSKRKVPYIQPTFPFGSNQNAFKHPLSSGELLKMQYDTCKAKGYKHFGLYRFTSPTYVVIDPKYIRNIMTKDFDYFINRGVYFNEKNDPLSANLFSLEGAKWRNLRAKLTPTFTSGKMKMMFSIMVECGNQLEEAVEDFSVKRKPCDVKDLLVRFTTNIIGSCAFGLDCNCFKDPDSEFKKYGTKVFKVSKLQMYKTLLIFTFPDLAKKLGLRFVPTDSSQFFMRILKDSVEYREKNNVTRKDFLQLLIDLKNNQNGNSLTVEELAAQAYIFFIAGFETSSTAMTFSLFELASNADIQNKARDEVNTVLEKYEGKLTYEAIAEMKYLSQVIDETLRKYPPVTILTRMCEKDYKIPDSDVIIEKDIKIFIPVLGLHHDPEHFPEPDKFDPERFSDERRGNIKSFTYMPFGEGPRLCIGMRFGIMQAKIGLAVLLKNYKFILNKKTSTPLKIDNLSFIMAAKEGVWLDIEKIIT